MKLVKVTGKAFTITCVKCGKRTYSDTKQFYADTEGKPFVDYYCETCSPVLCAAYAEHREELGKPEDWEGCSLDKGHEGNHK